MSSGEVVHFCFLGYGYISEFTNMNSEMVCAVTNKRIILAGYRADNNVFTKGFSLDHVIDIVTTENTAMTKEIQFLVMYKNY